jgi:hypothetical protein
MGNFHPVAGSIMGVAMHLTHQFFSVYAGLPLRDAALNFMLCLKFSVLGFIPVEYFVSLGYASAIVVQATAMLLLHRDTLRGWVVVQSGLMLAYGVKLGVFLALREKTASYKTSHRESTGRGAPASGLLKGAISAGVSLLYVVMFCPALLSVSAQAAGVALPSGAVGLIFMAAGPTLETSANW